MATANELPDLCVECRHAATDHNPSYGCDARVLTVHDTETNCQCGGFISEDDVRQSEAERRCRRCGRDANYCPCTTGYDPYRGMIW